MIETCVQGSVPILILLLAARAFPGVSPSVQSWLWRIVFLKLALGLAGFMWISLEVLPSEPAYEAAAIGGAASPAAEGLIGVWLTGAYGVGLALIAVRAIAGLVNARRLVLSSETLDDERLNRVLDLLVRRARVARRPRLLVSDEIATPMLVGGLRSSIVLPRSALSGASSEELGLMIAHEVGHIARKDLAWTLFQSIVHAFLFFHPIVWAGARASNLARESAADQLAMHLAGSKPKVYGQMLIRSSLGAGRSSVIVPAGIPMAESYRTVQRRLVSMQHFNRRPSLGRTTVTFCLAVLTAGLLPTYQLVAKAAEPQSAAPPVAQSSSKRIAPTATSPNPTKPKTAARHTKSKVATRPSKSRSGKRVAVRAIAAVAPKVVGTAAAGPIVNRGPAPAVAATRSQAAPAVRGGVPAAPPVSGVYHAPPVVARPAKPPVATAGRPVNASAPGAKAVVAAGAPTTRPPKAASAKTGVGRATKKPGKRSG